MTARVGCTIRAQGSVLSRIERGVALRALAIADQAMTERLRAHCQPSNHLVGVKDCLRPCGADGKPVRRVNDAGPRLLEAFTWLFDRGLARLIADSDGDQLIVLTRGDA